MTKEEFINSGRFIYYESFLKKAPNVTLHPDCTDVVEYANGLYIQVLKSGVFYLDTNIYSKSLDEVEDSLWDIELNKNKN